MTAVQSEPAQVPHVDGVGVPRSSTPAGSPPGTPVRRLVGYALFSLAMVSVLVTVTVTTVLPPASRPQVIGFEFMALTAACVVLMVRAATRRGVPRPARRPWWFVAGGVMALTAAGVISHSVSPAAQGSTPILLGEIIGRCLQVGLLLAGLFAFTTQPPLPRDWLKLGMDVGTALGGGVMVTWYLLVGPALTRIGDSRVELLAVLLPIVDLILLIGVLTVIMRGTMSSARWSVRLLLVACCLLVLSSGVQAHDLLSASGATEGEPVPAGLAMIATSLYACAAFEQLRTPYVADPPLRNGTAGSANHGVPYLALLVGYSLLMVTAVSSGIYPWTGLVGGAILMTGSVAARQWLALKENSDLVVTDGLTGLSNRRPVDAAITRALARSSRSGTPMAVLLLDLNGFKGVNDEFGHDAGDRMLVAFARALLASVRPVDLVARLGGDEFAVVLEEVTASQAQTVAQRILDTAAGAQVAETAGLPPIRCSIGIAIGDPLEPEQQPSPDELLRRADRAMYLAKRTEHHGWRVSGPAPVGQAPADPAPAPAATADPVTS